VRRDHDYDGSFEKYVEGKLVTDKLYPPESNSDYRVCP